MKRTENRKRLIVAASMILALGFPAESQAEPIVIVQETFERTDWSTPFGEAPNAVNLPGGVWTKTAGYSTFNPQIAPASWGSTPTKTLIMGTGGTGTWGQTKVGAAVPLTGYRPTSISAEAKMLWANVGTYGSVALGFYGTSLPAANTDGVGYLDGFTGISASRDGTLTLYENGVAGTSVSTGVTMSWNLRSLSYEMDTRTGVITNILWAGSPVGGLNSTAFTRPATVHAAVVAFDSPGGYSQTLVDNVVVQGVFVPKETVLLIY